MVQLIVHLVNGLGWRLLKKIAPCRALFCPLLSNHSCFLDRSPNFYSKSPRYLWSFRSVGTCCCTANIAWSTTKKATRVNGGAKMQTCSRWGIRSDDSARKDCCRHL